MRKAHYTVWWSDEDEAWLATEVGRPSGTVHGETPEDALSEAIEIAEEWDAAGFPGRMSEEWDAEAVRNLRRSLSMTQREFAGLLNISLSTVRSWEQGQRIPAGPTTRLLDMVQAAPGIARQMSGASEIIPEVA
jgi:DNA-binding transcriptional regulator YiaG